MTPLPRAGALACAVAGVLAGPAIAEPAGCFPEQENLAAVGRAFVYEKRRPNGAVRRLTRAVVAESAAGGVVVCEFQGAPGALGRVRRFWETDAQGRRVLFHGGGAMAFVIDGLPDCDRGLGACRRTLKFGAALNNLEVVEAVDRRCEDGVYIERAARSAGMGRAVVETRRSFDARGVLAREIGVRDGKTTRLTLAAESAWNGPDCRADAR